MINRDNLRYELDMWENVISVSENQFDALWQELKSVLREHPRTEYEMDSAWRYHNGGYYYKEIRISHPIPGRAFEIMDHLEKAIQFIPIRKKRE